MSPDHLLPQVYDELRKLAAAKMRGEADGHTLDSKALVWAKSANVLTVRNTDGRIIHR